MYSISWRIGIRIGDGCKTKDAPQTGTEQTRLTSRDIDEHLQVNF